MKLGQLIEYNMRNIFLEKLFIKCGEEKIKTEHISGCIFRGFVQSVFVLHQVEGYRNMLKISSRPLFLPHIKLF